MQAGLAVCTACQLLCMPSSAAGRAGRDAEVVCVHGRRWAAHCGSHLGLNRGSISDLVHGGAQRALVRRGLHAHLGAGLDASDARLEPHQHAARHKALQGQSLGRERQAVKHALAHLQGHRLPLGSALLRLCALHQPASWLS